jgi:hypothetical protein
VLATGHTTADEHNAIARAKRGKVLVTHGGEERAGPQLAAAQSAELADLGAVVELTAQTCKDQYTKDPKKLVEMIREIGPERCTLSSDYGCTATTHTPPRASTNSMRPCGTRASPRRSCRSWRALTRALLNLDFAS